MESTIKVLITGASGGFGDALVKQFNLNSNYEIFGTYKDHQIESLDKEHSFHVDLANPSSIETFVENLLENDIKFDVVINNAGIMPDKNFDECYPDLLIETLEVNLIGTVILTEELLNDAILSEDCTIINISSNLGSMSDQIDQYHPAYRISKAALNMYTRTLAAKFNETSRTIVALHPGWMKTNMGGEQAPTLPSESAEKLIELLKNKKFENGCFYSEFESTEW